MSGIRLQPGAPRHYGGSNRTIIKQAYEMLVSERTAMARQPVGTLVTLDKVYELVEGNLSQEKKYDIHEIGQRFKNEPEDAGWALRVAKVICLLEFLRDLPRTEANIAAFLVDRGRPARPGGPGEGGGQAAARGAVHPQHRGGLEAPDRPGEDLGDRAAGPPGAQAPGAERDHPHSPAGDLRRAGAEDLPPQGAPQLPHRGGGRGRRPSKTATCR